MPSLQSFASTFSNIFGGSQPDAAVSAGVGAAADNKNAGANQFASLLDVVGNIGDDNKAQPTRKDDVRDPVAAAVDAPSQFRDNKVSTKPDSSSSSAADVADKKTDSVSKRDDVSGKDAPKASQPLGKNDNKQVATGRKTDDSKDASAAKADNDNNADEVVSESDDLSKLKAKIADKIDDLSNLLAIIARLLAGANGGAVSVNVSSVQVVQLQVGASGDGVSDSTVSGDSSDPMAVFANLKDVFAQLQQFLQNVGSGNAPLTAEQDATLTAINNALQADIDALKGMFPQAVGGDDSNSIFSQLLQGQQTAAAQSTENNDSSQLQREKSSLQDDISLIRDALLKFREQRLDSSAAENSASKNQQPLLNSQPFITDADNSGSSKQDSGKNDQAAFTAAASVVAVGQNLTLQTSQPQNNNAVPSPVAAAIDSGSAGNSGGSFDGNSSQQGNNSGGQLSFNSSAVASQIRSGGGASHSQFSSMLNRALDTPVTEQVVFHVKTALGSGDSKITIQLNPEELGKLDITLDVDAKGKTGVTITADNKQTLDMLQRDSSGLQKALSDAGLKADSGSLNFNLRGGDREGQGQNGSQAANTYRKSQPDESQEEMNIASLATVTRSYVVNLPYGLDIKI